MYSQFILQRSYHIILNDDMYSNVTLQLCPLQNIHVMHRSLVEIDEHGSFLHAQLDFPITTAQNNLPMLENSPNTRFPDFPDFVHHEKLPVSGL